MKSLVEAIIAIVIVYLFYEHRSSTGAASAATAVPVSTFQESPSNPGPSVAESIASGTPTPNAPCVGCAHNNVAPVVSRIASPVVTAPHTNFIIATPRPASTLITSRTIPTRVTSAGRLTSAHLL